MKRADTARILRAIDNVTAPDPFPHPDPRPAGAEATHAERWAFSTPSEGERVHEGAMLRAASRARGLDGRPRWAISTIASWKTDFELACSMFYDHMRGEITFDDESLVEAYRLTLASEWSDGVEDSEHEAVAAAQARIDAGTPGWHPVDPGEPES